MISPDRPIRSASHSRAVSRICADGHHHAEVDDLVVVALEDDADDVLADVVDVALDGGHDDAARGPRRAGLLLGLDERHEMGDRLLHDPGALDDLGQEHLAGAEQVADDVHAVHQRPLDDLDRAGGGQAGLLGVLDDEGVDALDERVGQALLDGQLAPGERVGAGRAAPARRPRSATASSRSVASGRRLSTTSSTSSRSSGSMSS